MEIGTNRPDAMNHYGVAREASAIYDRPAQANRAQTADFRGTDRLQNRGRRTGTLSALHRARHSQRAAIKPSPENIAASLATARSAPHQQRGRRHQLPLWEMGKPTHVFDLDLLEGGKLVIRAPVPAKLLRPWTAWSAKLSTEDLVVADAVKPVGLAGVMGGFDTMITEQDPKHPDRIRVVGPGHGAPHVEAARLHTDASHRFERGADFESTVPSTNRVAELILNSGGGTLVGDVIDVIARKLDLAPVELDPREVHRILGDKLSTLEINRILTRLGFTVLPGSEDTYLVHIPSWRLDIEREIDVIEELARLHGYDKFPNTLPAYSGEVRDLPDAHKDARLRSSLLALGYNEAISSDFHFERGCPALLDRGRTRPGQSAERRSFGDAHVDGSQACSICWPTT
jgi:phenylalanyl-tRNA synthetase beta chain